MADVSELLALKIENAELRLQQLQQAGTDLVKQRNALIEEARLETGAEPDAIYNVQTRRFQPKG